MNTTTLTCIGFIQSLSKNYKDAVDTFHKALGQKREDTFSSTMLTCVLEMCIDEPPVLNDYLDEDQRLLQMCSSCDEETKLNQDNSIKLNDDNDIILSFRNPKFRLWNRRLRKKTDDDDTSMPMEDDTTAMVIDSSTAGDDSNFNMDLSTNMSTDSDSFK